MDNSEEKKKRATKTTRRQYELYLEELRANQSFRENKLDATQPNIIDESWQNVCQKFNTSGGPVKLVQEWKRVFTYWKSQVKSKARALKVAQQETGNKENKTKPLNDLESTLLDIIGHVVVDGDDQHIQTTYTIHIVYEKLMESNHNLDFVEIVNDEEVIAQKPLKKKLKIHNDEIVEKQSAKKKSTSLIGCLGELMDNNVEKSQQFKVLREIRDHLRNIEKHGAKRLKLEKLKMQVKFPYHIFVLNSDSE